MVGERNQNVIFIQINASSFAEFNVFEFDISRVDCNIIDVISDVAISKCYRVYLSNKLKGLFCGNFTIQL